VYTQSTTQFQSSPRRELLAPYEGPKLCHDPTMRRLKKRSSKQYSHLDWNECCGKSTEKIWTMFQDRSYSQKLFNCWSSV